MDFTESQGREIVMENAQMDFIIEMIELAMIQDAIQMNSKGLICFAMKSVQMGTNQIKVITVKNARVQIVPWAYFMK